MLDTTQNHPALETATFETAHGAIIFEYDPTLTPTEQDKNDCAEVLRLGRRGNNLLRLSNLGYAGSGLAFGLALKPFISDNQSPTPQNIAIPLVISAVILLLARICVGLAKDKLLDANCINIQMYRRLQERTQSERSGR